MRWIEAPRGAQVWLLRSMLVVAASISAQTGLAGQSLTYSSGQTVSPAYEGFEANPDGSYNLIFGYMNRNWLEEVDVPVGEGNSFSPGPADRGQPTHFLPRRNRFTFKVRVPADFGDQELVWTLTTRGETKMAYGSLRQDLLIDNIVVASETGALGAGRSDPETRSNTPPEIMIDGSRTANARVGQPVTLTARVTDDGLPLTTAQRRERARAQRVVAGTPAATPAPADSANATPEVSPEMRALQRAFTEPDRVTVAKSLGLHFTWFVYRGQNTANFEPIQIKPWEDTRAWMNSPWAPFWVAPPVPEDGRWVARVTFDEPGTYVLRGRADDGSLYADQEVTVNVAPLAN
ncbi:MAG: hypothetical protein EXR91_12510 [Gemmatimonadetes bacterium]|nr:hypothetical protein [Gemmatimonadota bacterium]